MERFQFAVDFLSGFDCFLFGRQERKPSKIDLIGLKIAKSEWEKGRKKDTDNAIKEALKSFSI